MRHLKIGHSHQRHGAHGYKIIDIVNISRVKQLKYTGLLSMFRLNLLYYFFHWIVI